MLNFVGIGAQKAGTTWIAENLAKHPDIAFPAGKEVHFWNKEYENGTDWYVDLFSKDEVISGDITPAYAFLELDKIKELHQLSPDLKLIYCVRNPIDRAWSAARMMLGRAEMTMDEASDEWFIDLFKSHGSRIRGDYISAVDNWSSAFDESQLLLLDFEDIKSHPNELLQEVCAHIGVDGSFFAQGSGNDVKEKVHKSVGSDQIRVSLLPVLHELYDEQIEAMKIHPILSKIYG